jgi:hypothetical protein
MVRTLPRALKGALITALTLALLLAVGVSQTPVAHAYGRLAQYQIGLSFNCNNTTYCGTDLGGFWGWAEFDSDNTADAQLAGCQHFTGSGPAGAQHFASDAQGWYIGPDGDFFIENEWVTYTGHTGGSPVTVYDPNPPYPSDTGIPAQPGHYSAQTLFGMKAPPGTNFEIQVVALH